MGLLAGAAYAVYKWAPIGTSEDVDVEFAKTACMDAARDRFNVSGIRVYDVQESNDGLVVRASVTLANSNRAKVTCLTNQHGTVRDVIIDER